MANDPSAVYARIAKLHAVKAAQAQKIIEAIGEVTERTAGSRLERRNRTGEADQLIFALERAALEADRLKSLMNLPADMVAHAVPALDRFEYGQGTAPATPQAERLSRELNAEFNPYAPDYEPNLRVEEQIAKVMSAVDGLKQETDHADFGVPAPVAQVLPQDDPSLSDFEKAGAAWAADAEGES